MSVKLPFASEIIWSETRTDETRCSRSTIQKEPLEEKLGFWVPHTVSHFAYGPFSTGLHLCSSLLLFGEASQLACAKVHVFMLSCVWLFATPWTVAHQAPLSMGFSKQEYWSGLPCPPPRDLPDPGIKAASPASPALQADFLPGKPKCIPSLFNFFPKPTLRVIRHFSSLLLREKKPAVQLTSD